MKIIYLFAVILLLSSCENDDKKIFYKPEFQSSEYPIWLTNECNTKELTFWVNQYSDRDLVVELDGKVQEMTIFNRVRRDRFNLLVNLEMKNVNGPLLLKDKYKDSILLEVPLIRNDIGDTITFVQRNLGFSGGNVPYGRKWWPNYYGGYLTKNSKILVDFTKAYSDEIIGDSLVRTVEIYDVNFTDSRSQKEFELDAITNKYKIKYYKWFPMIDSKANTLSSNRNGNKIEKDNYSVNTTVIKSSFKSNNEDEKPCYWIIGREYGKGITGIIKECNIIDTLISEPIKLPVIIEVGISSVRKIKK